MCLNRLRDSEAVPVLMDLVENDPQRSVRVLAAGALRRIADRSSVGFLAQTLAQTRDTRIKIHAVCGLAETGANEAVRPLVDALTEKSGTVRVAAACGLADLGDQSAVPAIEAALDSARNPFTRSSLRRHLHRLLPADARHGFTRPRKYRRFDPAPRPTRVNPAAAPRTLVNRTRELSVIVPESRAAGVQTAIERWLADRGITGYVLSERQADGKLKLAVHLAGDDAEGLDFADQAVTEELRQLLLGA